jgi:hypothetical protein
LRGIKVYFAEKEPEVKFFFSRAGYAAALMLILSGCASVGESSVPASGEELPQAAPEREISPEEMSFLVGYMDTLKYRVYFNEKSGEDPLLKETAVRMAQAFALFGESARNAEEDTADVYIELDALTEGESRGENHYGSAGVKCVLRESRSGTELGVLRGSAPRTFSKASQFDAKANALQSILCKMIPEAVEQTKGLMLELYNQGFPYELAVDRIEDARQAVEFWQALSLRLRSLRIAGNFPGETRYEFTFFGRPEAAEKAVYEAAASAAGPEGIKNVSVREKRILPAAGGL